MRPILAALRFCPNVPSHRDPTPEPTRTGRRGTSNLGTGSNEPTPTIQPAEEIARFQVLGCIGIGGMGQVYAAYDPQLDRKVALKVLHEERDHRDDPRLVREAQALARLAHPNVVAVHEVGAHEGRLFVAMEFVEGATLRDWVHRHPVDPDARLATVLDYLIQAGEGLAAAHRAGLVHRDFKPGNVLIGDDGRVRVVDFGLVRVEAGPNAEARGHLALVREESPVDDDLSGLLDDRPLTRPGAMVGTPAYMAPEQFLLTKINAATDQFAFCTTAWEAIFEKRPFTGKTIPAVLEAIRKQRPDRSLHVECPKAIEAALLKGLSFGPGRRHASMEVLLKVLRDAREHLEEEAPPSPAPSRRWHWLAILTLVGITGAALALGLSESKVCTGAEQHLAGIWGTSVEAKLESAFLGTEATFAPDTWARFDRELNDYAQQWVAGHRDACEAAQVRRDQSTELMDQRMACLNTRRQALVAITEVYAHPDAQMLARADEAIAALPPVSACADSEYVRHRGMKPESPAQATLVEGLLQSIALSSAHEAAGRYQEALELAEQSVTLVESTNLPASLARAHLRRGTVHTRMRQGERAREDLQRAYLLATQANVPEVAFEASRMLIQVNTILLVRFGEGRWWAEVARFESERFEEDDALARLHVDLGSMYRAEGRFVEAGRSYEEAVELIGRGSDSGGLAHATALGALGELRLLQRAPVRGLSLLEEAAAMAKHALGPEHPSMADFHTSLSEANRLGGKLDQALEHIDRAITLSERAFGPDHVALHPMLEERCTVLHDRGDTAEALIQLKRARGLHEPEPVGDAVRARLFATEGELRFQQHAFDEAEHAFGQAVELASATLGNAHPETARYRISLGAALGGQGRRTEATALIQAGLAIRETVLGGQHPNVASTYDTLAAEMERVGDYDKVLEYTKRSLEIIEATYGEDGLPLIRTHGNMCAVLGHLGRVDEAITHCQRALDITRSAVSVDQRLVAELHNDMGAALANSGRYAEAVEHYESAKAIWERSHGMGSVSMAIVLANLGEVALAQGQHDVAYARYAESLEIREQQLGSGHPMIIVPLVGMANAMTVGGRAGEAVVLARRALEVSANGGAGDLAQARAEEALARALWAEPGGRAEALRLVARAREVFEHAGSGAAIDRERLAGWYPGKRASVGSSATARRGRTQ